MCVDDVPQVLKCCVKYVIMQFFFDPSLPIQRQNGRFNPNTEKYGSEKTCILTNFTQQKAIKHRVGETSPEIVLPFLLHFFVKEYSQSLKRNLKILPHFTSEVPIFR